MICFPNFRLAAAAIDGRDLRSASKEFTVERELKVVLKPLKDAFLPGEDGKVEITVTDQIGKPVEAELSLALGERGAVRRLPGHAHADPRFLPEGSPPPCGVPYRCHLRFRYDGTTRAVAKALTDEKGRLASTPGWSTG